MSKLNISMNTVKNIEKDDFGSKFSAAYQEYFYFVNDNIDSKQVFEALFGPEGAPSEL